MFDFRLTGLEWVSSKLNGMIGPFEDKNPQIDPSAFIHASAEIYGAVKVGKQSAIFQYCVMRGDVNRIEVGDFTNIQELSVLHVSDGFPCILKDWVTVGHNATIHGGTVEKGALIGIGSVILDGAIIGEEAWVAAGAVVIPGTKVPPRTIIAGTPGKIIRELKQEEVDEVYRRAKRYIERLAPFYKGLQKN